MHSFVDWTGLFLIKVLILIVNILPLSWALLLGRFWGRIVYSLHKRRRVAYVNLKAAFGSSYQAGELKKIARKMYENIAQTAVELFRMKKINRAFIESHVTVHGFDHLQAAEKEGRGVIFLTAHFGNWELLSNVAALLGYPFKILARDQKHSRLNDLLNEMREAHGNEVIGKGMAIRAMMKALYHNDIVGMLSDQSGGSEGVYVDFFGRRTTTPAGVVTIAKRTNCVVLPSFIVREKDGKHRVDIKEPMVFPDTGDENSDLENGLRTYLELVEEYVRAYPEQWLWGHKRWKHTLDKTLLVLSDSKAGHVTQSKALMALYDEIGEKRGYAFRKVICNVEYHSPLHRMLLHGLAPFLAPCVQGRLDLLRLFLKKESAQKICSHYTDVVITCGSGTVPVGLLLARENMAKLVSIMKPPFPYAGYNYELLILPEHDRFTGRNHRVVRLKTALSLTTEAMLQSEAAKLTERIGPLSGPVVSILFGGDTKKYRMEKEWVEKAFDAFNQLSNERNVTLLVTTSRRTRADIIDCIKAKLSDNARCRLLVIPTEENIENVVYGMIGLADTVFVTEDSISMISESVQAGKTVGVLRMAAKGLPRKHANFQTILEESSLIVSCTYKTICDVYQSSSHVEKHPPFEDRRNLINILEGCV
jgi:KDO2-lipid IV(A) lauroyltransferase